MIQLNPSVRIRRTVFVGVHYNHPNLRGLRNLPYVAGFAQWDA